MFPCETLLAERLCFLLNIYVHQEALHFANEHKTGQGNTREYYRFNVLAKKIQSFLGKQYFLWKKVEVLRIIAKAFTFFYHVLLVNSENWSLN